MQDLIYQDRESATVKENHTVSVRAVKPEDLETLRGMASRLSPQTIYQRFHAPYPAVPEWMLASVVNLDDQAGSSLVAVARDEIVGHAMHVRTADGAEAEVAVVVEDGWQSKGVGKVLLCKLATEAVRQGVEVFTGVALGENRRVLSLLRSVFAEVKTSVEDGSYVLRMPLQTSGSVRGCGDRTRLLRHDEAVLREAV